MSVVPGGLPQRRQVYAVCASLSASPAPADYEGPVNALALRRFWDTAGELSHPIGLTGPH
jgi:hypothetical protein